MKGIITHVRLNSMKQSLIALFLISLVTLNSTRANSLDVPAQREFQPTKEIHQLVENHIKQKVDQKLFEPTVQVRKLSENLRLPLCETPLELLDNRPNKVAGRMTIRVHCTKPKWQVFVPASVNGKLPIVISTKAILKKAVITHEDIMQIHVAYNKVPVGTLVTIEKAVGMRLKRAIGPNQPIKVRDLTPPYWVFKNREVNIITKIGDIEVKTKGTALKSGVFEDQIPVKNNASKKVINGIVIAPNTVAIP